MACTAFFTAFSHTALSLFAAFFCMAFSRFSSHLADASPAPRSSSSSRFLRGFLRGLAALLLRDLALQRRDGPEPFAEREALLAVDHLTDAVDGPEAGVASIVAHWDISDCFEPVRNGAAISSVDEPIAMFPGRRKGPFHALPRRLGEA